MTIRIITRPRIQSIEAMRPAGRTAAVLLSVVLSVAAFATLAMSTTMTPQDAVNSASRKIEHALCRFGRRRRYEISTVSRAAGGLKRGIGLADP